MGEEKKMSDEEKNKIDEKMYNLISEIILIFFSELPKDFDFQTFDYLYGWHNDILTDTKLSTIKSKIKIGIDELNKNNIKDKFFYFFSSMQTYVNMRDQGASLQELYNVLKTPIKDENNYETIWNAEIDRIKRLGSDAFEKPSTTSSTPPSTTTSTSSAATTPAP